MPSNDDFRSYVETVRDASAIVDVVGADSPLRRHGRALMCSSPFRRDRDPSFAVYEDGRWYDFGTSEGGDVFAYIMARDSTDFRGALDVLAERAGIEAWATRSRGEVDPHAAAVLAGMLERRWVAELINEAADFYHRTLPSAVRAMIRERWGFTDEQIDRFRVGWSNGALLTYMHNERGESLERLLKTGLFVKTRAGVFDFFERRIMFPYFSGGLARYMIGRRVEGHTDDSDWEQGKYKKQLLRTDSRDYVSRHVSHILYGLDSCRGRRDVLVITEGVTDAMSAIAAGYACISPVTVVFRDADIARMLEVAQRFERVVVFNDLGEESDAGTKGALKTADALFAGGVDVRIVDLRSLSEGAA